MNPATLSAMRDDYHARILRVLVHIQQHLDEDLPLDALAEIACFSPFHFHRVFKGFVGEGVAEHVRRLRLERAAHQLRNSDEPIVRIALLAGFQSQQTFTRAFTPMLGEPPAAFRDRHRAVAYPAAPSGVHFAADGRPPAFHPASPGDRTVEVQIEQLPPCHVVFVHHIGPYAGVGAAWARLCGWAGPRGLFGPATRCLGLSYDDPAITPPDKLRYDACLTVPPGTVSEADIGVQTLPGGEFVTTIHAGPYEHLNRTYEHLCGQWLPKSGRAMGDPPSYEFYLNNPQTTPPEELRTKVCMRLV